MKRLVLGTCVGLSAFAGSGGTGPAECRNVRSAGMSTDAFGCKRIDLEATGKMVSLPVEGVDFTSSSRFALDGYITDLSTAGAIYLALIDGKGNKRRYSVCDLEVGHWNVMTFDRDETVWKSAHFDWKDVRKANVWVPAAVWMPGSTNATVSLWLGNLRSAPGPVAWRAPAAGERRFAWCKSTALGDRGNWTETAAFLAKWKFTDVIVAAGRAGGAHYKSDVLPLAKDALPGDPLREAIAACRPLGIRVHAMISSFRCTRGGTPDELLRRFREEGRFQVDSQGNMLQHHKDHWLCPSDPRTREHLVAIARELVEQIGVDGVQLDYIRYSTPTMCFCPRCLRLFSEREGRTFANEAEIRADPAVLERWNAFREDNISSVVKAVGDWMHAAKRPAEFSVTCFPDAEDDRAKVAQDYARWAREGWIDILVPMDYTPDTLRYRKAVSRQAKALAGTKAKLVPGIGVCLAPFAVRPSRYVQHVNFARELNLSGFAVWVIDPRGERFYDALEKSPFATEALK